MSEDYTKKKKKKRPFICMNYECCHVYTRIYLNKKRNAFVGWCPKCGRQVTVEVSDDGEPTIFFRAG